ncbi:MAG: hypothetical protein AAFN10_02510 [Bacteroidota bacterium]
MKSIFKIINTCSFYLNKTLVVALCWTFNLYESLAEKPASVMMMVG